MEHDETVTTADSTATESRSVQRRLAIQTADDQAPASTPAPAPKKKTPNKPKARALEVLDTISPKAMTPEERVAYIMACRQALHQLNNKCNALEENCKKAYEQFRNADDSYNKLKADADSKLTFAKQTVEVCAKTIAMIGGTR